MNVGLQAKLFGGARVTKIQPVLCNHPTGILSGSRDHSRPAEEVGVVLHRLANLYQKSRLQNLADGSKPLDAPEVVDFIMRIFENTLIIQADQHVRNIYEPSDIHEFYEKNKNTHEDH